MRLEMATFECCNGLTTTDAPGMKRHVQARPRTATWKSCSGQEPFDAHGMKTLAKALLGIIIGMSWSGQEPRGVLGMYGLKSWRFPIFRRKSFSDSMRFERLDAFCRTTARLSKWLALVSPYLLTVLVELVF